MVNIKKAKRKEYFKEYYLNNKGTILEQKKEYIKE